MAYLWHPLARQVSGVVMLKDPNDPSKLRNYCFVHYDDRLAALKAVDDCEAGPKPEIDGNELVVHLARPQPNRPEVCVCCGVVPICPFLYPV